MTVVTTSYRVCSYCGGVTPPDVDQYKDITITQLVAGAVQQFFGMDFCCTEHLLAMLTGQPTIPTPSPLYPQPTVTTPVLPQVSRSIRSRIRGGA